MDVWSRPGCVLRARRSPEWRMRPSLSPAASSRRRESFARISEVAPIPNLIKVQRDSFEWFLREGLKELFAEISPIKDFTGNMDLELPVPADVNRLPSARPRSPRTSAASTTSPFAAPLKVRMRLDQVRETGEIKEQDIFMGDFPHHDRHTAPSSSTAPSASSSPSWSARRASTSPPKRTRRPGRDLCMRQADPEPRRLARVRDLQPRRHVGQGRPQAQDPGHHAAARAAAGRAGLAADRTGTDEEILALFDGHRRRQRPPFVQATLDKDPAKQRRGGAARVLPPPAPRRPAQRRQRAHLLNALFFNFRRYDLGKVGRYKVNKRLGLQTRDHQRAS